MIRKDFHKFSTYAAIREVERIIGRVRIHNKMEAAEFITGDGEIKQALLKLLKEYQLTPLAQVGNHGTILVTIE